MDLTDAAAAAGSKAQTQGLESVQRPALIVSGEFDLDNRKRFAGQLAMQLPQAECVEIPDTGHLCNLDNPDAYNDALRRFLQRHAPWSSF